ncbi:MAG TPA: TolC family protein [Bryobacteraceae bacterium]|nr:TolC family protein [Bryobacteraceae bacterium]
MRALAVLLGLLAPCSGEDRRVVSSGLTQRTGHGLAESGQTGSVPAGVSLDGPITSNQAVAIALWNNKTLQTDLAALGFAEADLVDAKLLRNPLLQILFPAGPKRFELFLSMPVELLWQRPKRIRLAEGSLHQLSEALVQNGLNLARDVKLAYADALLAEDRLRVASGSAELRGKIVEFSERRLRAGDIGQTEVQALRVEAQIAADQRELFRDGRRVAQERLRGWLGLPRLQSDLQLVAEDKPVSLPPNLAEVARQSRPDLRAAQLAIDAAKQRVAWEKSRWAVIAPGLSSKGSGTTPIHSSPALSAEIPILNRNQGGIERARAELRRAEAAHIALLDQVDSELRQALAQWQQAVRSIERVRTQILPAITESVNLAERSFRQGDSSRLNVMEATRQLYDAQAREVEALALTRRAWAELERSAGKTL